MLPERTVAIVEPNVTNGVVVNVEVVPADWTNTDPQHLIEYTPENPAAIGWAVIDGVAQMPPEPPSPDDE